MIKQKTETTAQRSASDGLRWRNVRGARYALGIGALALAAAGCAGPDFHEEGEADDSEGSVESLQQASIFNEDGSFAEGPNGQIVNPKPDTGGTYDANQPGGISRQEQLRREGAELARLEAACGSDRNCRWDALTPQQREALLDPVRTARYYGLKATPYVIGGFFFGHYVAAGKWTYAALEGTAVGVKFSFDVGLVNKKRKVTVDFKGKAADLYGGDKALLRKVMAATPVIWRRDSRFTVERGSPASVVRFKKLDGSTTEWKRLDSLGFKSGFDKGYVTWTGVLDVYGNQSIQFANGLDGGGVRTEVEPMGLTTSGRSISLSNASPNAAICGVKFGFCEALRGKRGWTYSASRLLWSYRSPFDTPRPPTVLYFSDLGRYPEIRGSL